MDIDLAHLPDDTAALKALVHALAGEVKAKNLKIAQLEARIAKLRRLQFGQSSEKIAREIEQLELELDELHEDDGVLAAERPAAVQVLREKPARRPLPEHLPRQDEFHEPSCSCLNCGGQLRRLAEDETEVLEYVPASFKVIRHVRPKLSCRVCETIVQAPMPSLPIDNLTRLGREAARGHSIVILMQWLPPMSHVSQTVSDLTLMHSDSHLQSFSAILRDNPASRLWLPVPRANLRLRSVRFR